MKQPILDAAAIPPPAGEGGVPYRKLFRWGAYVVSGALGAFLANLALTVLVQTLTQYNVQVLASVVSGLAREAGGPAPARVSGGEQPPPDRGGGGSFLARLVPERVQTAALVFASLAVALILLGFLDRLLTAWTDNIMLGRLQQRLHDKLLALGPDYHARHDLGETTVVVTRFSAGAQMLLRDLLSTPVVQGVGFVTALVFLAANLGAFGDTPLWMRGTLLSLLVLLPLGGWWLSGVLQAAFTRVRDAELALANEFTNSASLPLEVQLLGAQAQRSASFAARLAESVRAKLAAAARNEVARQFQASVPVILQTCFLVYGVFYALKAGNPAAVGSILALFYFVPAAVAPVQHLVSFVTGLSSSWPQVQTVVEVLESEPPVKDAPGARDLALAGPPEVRLERVTFAYHPGAAPVLAGLDHAFPAGRVSAIVGRAGSGKSSILNLVARLYDPQAGRVTLGGADLVSASLSSLRRSVAKVSQFPLFLADTMRANLLLARAEATDFDLEAACRRTGLWEVLVRTARPGTGPLDQILPRSAGQGLSGGERRLLGVTRALLWQPRVLLLDEPTTGIDALGRQALAAVLREACAGVTVLLVDHDMEFVHQVADVVACLEGGRFNEVGPPAELAAAEGSLYQRLRAAAAAEPAAEAAPLEALAFPMDAPPGLAEGAPAFSGPDPPMKKKPR